MIFSRKGNQSGEMDALTLSRQGGGDDSNAKIAQLEHKVERLTALLESMWSILESKSSLTDKQLMAKLEDIMELRESRIAPRNACSKCKQKNPVNKSACLYCGTPLPKLVEADESPFNF